MQMAKTSKSLSMNLETKAYDILYDNAQGVNLSVTAFVERLAYMIGNKNKHDRDQLLQIVLNSKEPSD